MSNELSEFAKLIAEGKRAKQLEEENKKKSFFEKYSIEKTEINPFDFIGELIKLKKESEQPQQEVVVEEILPPPPPKSATELLSELASLIAEGKKANGVVFEEQKENIESFVAEVVQDIAELKEEEIKQEEIKEEPVEKDLIAQAVDSITKVAENTNLFDTPEPDKVSPNFKAIQAKLKSLEQWVAKISTAGSGSGSYWLNDLGDTDKTSLQNATDGQVLTFNVGVGKWIAADSSGGGSGADQFARDTANGATNLAQSSYDFANTITLSGNIDAYARNQAANAAANTVYTQGVDAWQNTQINNTNTLAQAAFNYANTFIDTSTDQFARDTANSAKSNTVYTQNVDVSQNSRMAIIEGTDTSQNTAIAATDGKMSSAYNQANTGTVLAQAAYDKANTGGGSSSSTDQFARDAANTATANTIYTQGVDVSQNNRMVVIEGTNVTQNTNISATDGKMQNAYNQANTGTDLAQTVSDTANNILLDIVYLHNVDYTQNTDIQNTIEFVQSIHDELNVSTLLAQASYDQANTGLVLAQAAFDVANTGGAGGGTLDQFARNTANTGLVLAQASYNQSNASFLGVNTSITIIQGTDVSQNNRLDYSNAAITSTDGKMQSSYNQANTGTILAQAAYDKANTFVDTYTDQYARDTANTATANTIYIQGTDVSQNNRLDYSNTAIAIIQGVDVGQNARMVIIEGTNVTQNNNIAATDGKMQSAYLQANTGTVLAQAAFDKANTGSNSTGSNSFSTILVSGQPNVVANSANSPLTFVAGSGINITTVGTSNTITFSSTGGFSGGTILDQLIIANNITSTYTTTGALQVQGGVGVTGNVWAEQLYQTSTKVSIGASAGSFEQGPSAVAVGSNAGATNQGISTVAVGEYAGSISQLQDAVAVGTNAGYTGQGYSGVAIGAGAGSSGQGNAAVAIGAYAGQTDQPAGSVIINASASALNGSNAGLYVDPVRNDVANTANVVYYDAVTKELTYAPAPASGGGTLDQYARDTANSGLVLAQSGYNQANASFLGVNSAITIIQGTDVTQNTAISSTDGKMQSAYNQANLAIGIDTTQNTRLTVIEGTNLSQNVRIDYSNTSIAIIQGVDVSQNARMVIIENANLSQNVRLDYSNTAISSTDGKMSSAYDQANTGLVLAQAAYDNSNTKFNSSGGTISGNVSITKDLSISGNLTVLGTATTLNTSSFSVTDSLALLAVNNYTTDLLDIGIVGHYNNTQNAHTGIFRDASEKEWMFFDNYTPEITSNNNVIISDPSFRYANVRSATFKGNLIATTAVVNGNTVLTAGDLVTVTHLANYITMNPALVTVPVVGTSTTYGLYNFGDITSIQTYGDYNTVANTGFYSVNDATGAPGHIEYIGFTDVIDFNRIVLNINYTASSGHVQNIDVYNYQTDSWDTFGTYSGSGSWQQFALQTIDAIPYISSGNVTIRNYHVSSGNVQHRTWIDYAAVEKSINGGQGPRGPTGATGPTGPVDTSSFNKANSANVLAQAAFDQANTGTVLAQASYNQANVTIGIDTTQNSRMVIIEGTDVSQNVRIDYSNSAITIIQGTDDGQNSRMTIIEGTNASQNVRIDFSNTRMGLIDGTDVSQNARMTIIEGTNASQNVRLDYSNTAITIIQGTDVGQNSRMSVIENTDFSQNTRIDYSNSAITIIQGVDATQNTRLTVIEGADVSQNTRIDYSNAAIAIIQGTDTSQNVRLDYSNTAITIIQGVDLGQNTDISSTDGKMQSAYNQANTGTVLAQAAFDKANTGGSSGGTLDQYARDTANTATANTIYIQGTDVSQNNRLDYSNTAITSNQIYSQAAFAKANNAVANLGPVITVNSTGYLYVSNTFVSTSNVTGALVVSGGVGVTGNVNASAAKFVSTVVPTYDTVSISNAGFPVTTLGVSALQMTYVGGAAAIEASAARVDLTPGSTAGGIWNGYRFVATNAAGSGVALNAIKVDSKGAGAGTSNVFFVGTGYDSILNYNGTSIIGGTGSITPIAGTTTVPPIQFGTNSVVTTTPLPNAFESDGSSLYYTTQSLSANNGRQIIKAAQVASITTPVGVASGAQYFAGSRPQLTANHVYQFNYFLSFKKVTAGSVTFSFSNSNTTNFLPLQAQIIVTSQPGIATGNTIMGVYANNAATTTSSAIQLNANGGYSVFINGVVEVANDTRLQLLVTDSAGTIAANTGSIFTLTDLGITNTGNLA